MVITKYKNLGNDLEWNGEVPVYDSSVSHRSAGWKACQLWKRQLGQYKSLARKSNLLVYTGIGVAVAGQVRANGVLKFGDGSVVYPEIELSKFKEKKVPRVVFLVVSAIGSDEIVNLLTLAEEFKEQGVKIIIPVFTSFAHERQDHKFKGKSGNTINQLTTLKGVVSALSGARKLGIIHGAIAIGNHSQRACELALRWNFPLLLVDTFDFMVSGARLDKTVNPFVIGPDKGRYNISERLAARLNCPYVASFKTRAREKFGDPTVVIEQRALEYIKKEKCHVVVIDDEVREAGTVAAIRKKVNGYAKYFTFAALKTIMAPSASGKKTAIDRLKRKLKPGFVSEQYFFANAVQPLLDTAPIEKKIKWLNMKPQLEAIFDYLANNLDEPAGPRNDGDYPGCSFSVDLHEEKYI